MAVAVEQCRACIHVCGQQCFEIHPRRWPFAQTPQVGKTVGFPSCHWMWCDGGGGKATCQVTNVLRQPTRSSSAHPKQATFISTRSCHSLAGFGQQCNGGAQKEAGGDRPRLSALSPPASRQPHASRHVSSTSLTSGREPVVDGAHLDRRRSKYSAAGGLCSGKRARGVSQRA